MAYLVRLALIIGAAVLFAGCVGSQLPIGAPPLVPQADALLAHAGKAQYRVLFSFGSNVHAYGGFRPEANLINLNGTLYGTTAGGGSGGLYNSYGAVFRISTSGKEKAIYSFKGGPDGATPQAALVALNGVLYGTTFAGGWGCESTYRPYSGCGVVFSVTPSGNEKVLHRFGGPSARDGIQPSVPLVAVGKDLYGTTYFGGAYRQGTIFRVSTDGKEQIVHDFHATTANHDGAYPMAGLINVDGVLYGTASEGQGRYYNGGAVFKITTSGQETILYNFGDTKDGGLEPDAPLVAAGNRLYGTTSAGGAFGHGVVFTLSTTGAHEHVIWNFGERTNDGTTPETGLISIGNVLYGTTTAGGSNGGGTLFSVTTRGVEHILHDFGSIPNDGYGQPSAVLNFRHLLYGTTQGGGESPPSCPYSYGCQFGTVYVYRR
ncbi:MAG TPA: choice-of-anchor tandem repeat GloVer-containing protein [Candidatus Cybelea sp.]